MSIAITVRLADVDPERVDWLWFGRLPLGKIVLLDGDPSVGKSTTAVDCAARVSTGRAWPDGAPNRVGAVLLLSAEDGLADTIRPRLDAASGDPSKVHALTEIRYVGEDGKQQSRPVTLADLEEIEHAVRKVAAVLVVIDVLMAFLPGRVDSHRDQDVRGVLSGLAAMAERTSCCVLLLRHLNKSAGGAAMYRGGGSIGIIGAARVGLLAAIDPEDAERRVLAGIKSNLAPVPAALAYQLVDSPEHGCARVEWLGTSQHSAGSLLSAPADDERTERDEASRFLIDYLTENGGEASPADVKKAASAAGISVRTIERTRSGAGVKLDRSGFPARSVWRIDPTVSPQSRQSRHVPSAGETGETGGESALNVVALIALADCGHPQKVITTSGRCGLCIADRHNHQSNPV